MRYKEKRKSRFTQKLEKYPPEQRLAIIRIRKVLRAVICILVVLSLLYFTPAMMIGFSWWRQDIHESFLFPSEITEAKPFLDKCNDFFISNAREITESDTNVYKVIFDTEYRKVEIIDNDKQLLREISFEVPKDIHLSLCKFRMNFCRVIVYENEIDYNYYDELKGIRQLCRSLNNFPPTEGLKEGLYLYITDGWWNYQNWYNLKQLF